MTEKDAITQAYWQLREAIRAQLFSHLNTEQLRAVETGEGPVLCLAGAGSGKTTAMVNRILHLYLFGPCHEAHPPLPPDLSAQDLELMKAWLEEKQAEKKGSKRPGKAALTLPAKLIELIRVNGVEPWSILAITFTNKAAAEMKSRLSLLLGPSMNEMWVMTFHAACVRILRREIGVLGMSKDFTIYDDQDQGQVVRALLKELNIDDKRFTPRAVQSAISRHKCQLKTAADSLKTAGDFFEEKVAQVYSAYEKRLKTNNALDFDDLLMSTVQLFKSQPEILSKYQQRFRYILVDEYQDTNHVQYTLVSLLAQKWKNICVVGDDDQSIYAFRQADIRNILDFERDYPQAKVIKLEQNYRSTPEILEAANSVIAYNTGRKKKTLWTENHQGERLTLYKAVDERDEARFVSESIVKLVGGSGRYQDCAVLIRTNAQSRVFEEWFIRKGIPYRIVGGQKFYERKEIKDILAYLKFLANPTDTVSLERIINVPRRGVGETTLEKILELSRSQGISAYQAVKSREELKLGAKVAKGLAGFAALMDSLYEAVDTLSITQLAERIIHDTGYFEDLQGEKSVEAESRMENLKEFLTKTQDYEQQAEEPTLADFLSQVSLVTDLDSYQDETRAVVVMTMHMAKGLEFANVYVVGLEEGVFPHSRALLEPSEMEEERRLCYVAMTRAKERLYLVNTRMRMLYGRTSHNMPSRFLEEIPEHLWEEYKNEDFFKTVPTYKTQGKSTTQSSAEVVLGDKVEHEKWGQGLVVGIKGEAEDMELQIAFPAQGIRNLLAKYAPLKKV